MPFLSQFFALSFRGDVIAIRDYLADVGPEAPEIFFRRVKFWEGGEAPPVFKAGGVHYAHIVKGGLFLVATARDAGASPALMVEFLLRIAKCMKDYCGRLNEDVLRTNFVLFYELLDELVDFGYPQNSSTEQLKRYVLTEPTLPPRMAKRAVMSGAGMADGLSVPRVKSVMDIRRDPKGRDEVFVDIVESISITFSAAGAVTASQVNGCIQMRSFLKSNPDIRIALNENLQVAGRDQGGYGGGYGGGGGVGVALDDCNFSEVVRLEAFDSDRTMAMTPLDGEFVVMNYRTTRDYAPPFRVTTGIEEIGPNKVELLVKVRADFPPKNSSSGFVLLCPVPKSVLGVHFDLGKKAQGQSVDHSPSQHHIRWVFQKIKGGEQHTLAARISLDPKASISLKRDIGPVNLQFSIPSYNVSGLQVRFLQILKDEKGYNPYRWVRYITQSDSYVCRV